MHQINKQVRESTHTHTHTHTHMHTAAHATHGGGERTFVSTDDGHGDRGRQMRMQLSCRQTRMSTGRSHHGGPPRRSEREEEGEEQEEKKEEDEKEDEKKEKEEGERGRQGRAKT